MKNNTIDYTQNQNKHLSFLKKRDHRPTIFHLVTQHRRPWIINEEDQLVIREESRRPGLTGVSESGLSCYKTTLTYTQSWPECLVSLSIAGDFHFLRTIKVTDTKDHRCHWWSVLELIATQIHWFFGDVWGFYTILVVIKNGSRIDCNSITDSCWRRCYR